MYTVEAIVLRRYDYRPNKSVLTVFSRDFGRFDCFYTPSKLSPKIDTGVHIRATVSTKQGKNTLGTILSFQNVHTKDWDYITYESFLWFVAVSYKLLPEGNAYVQLFDNLKSLYEGEPSSIESICKITFLTLRLLVIFGIHLAVEDVSFGDLMDKLRHSSYEDMKPQISSLDHHHVRLYAQRCCDQFLSQT